VEIRPEPLQRTRVFPEETVHFWQACNNPAGFPLYLGRKEGDPCQTVLEIADFQPIKPNDSTTPDIVPSGSPAVLDWPTAKPT
jgi:hypothetical protein